MVFALVGDSTMTSDFGNVTLFPVIQVEATTNQVEATNMTKGFGSSLLAFGSWPSMCNWRFFLFRYRFMFSCFRLLQQTSASFRIRVLQAMTQASFEFW